MSERRAQTVGWARGGEWHTTTMPRSGIATPSSSRPMPAAFVDKLVDRGQPVPNQDPKSLHRCDLLALANRNVIEGAHDASLKQSEPTNGRRRQWQEGKDHSGRDPKA